MRLSFVTTLYLSAPYLEELHRRCRDAADGVGADFEMVLVNDGSPDDSLAVALALREADRRVKVVDLSRNFGQHKAILTGLAHSAGELVFLLDSDLEEDPGWVERFLERMRETGADVVYGVQRARKGRLAERLTGALFYRLFRILSPYPVPANQVTARLMSRRYVDSLVAHRDREVFLAGLWAITGYEQVALPVDKLSKGRSSYTVAKKLELTLNSVTSFSNKPLVMIFYLGIGVTVVSLSAALGMLIAKLYFIDFEYGWPSLIISIWFLGGLTLLCLGVIGMYLSKIFTETKERPYTIVRRVYGSDGEEPG